MPKKPASKNKTHKAMQMSARYLSVLWVLFFATSTIVFYFANKWFPKDVVLGNHVVTPNWGLVLSVGLISLIGIGFAPVIEVLSEYFRFKLKDRDWMILYFFINFAAIWVVSRFAEQIGLGISSAIVVAALAVLLDMVQSLVAMLAAKWFK